MDIFGGLRKLLGIRDEQPKSGIYTAKDGRQIPLPAKAMIADGQPGGYAIPQQPTQALNDSWDINDSSAIYNPNDPRSEQGWTRSGIETNGTGARRTYSPGLIPFAELLKRH